MKPNTCTCKKSNWDSLSCPKHGLDVQAEKRKNSTVVDTKK